MIYFIFLIGLETTTMDAIGDETTTLDVDTTTSNDEGDLFSSIPIFI